MNKAVIGLQWGDEGKGKLVDWLSDDFDIICRYQGGANAGHTVIYREQTIPLHLIPSGIFHRDKTCILGNGMVIDIKLLQEEINQLKEAGVEVEDRLLISRRAHVVLPDHYRVERKYKKELGTTGKGIGPAYSDKAKRTGLRMGDLFNEKYLEKFEFDKDFLSLLHSFRDIYKKNIVNTVELLHNFIEKGNKRILFEGAQGVLLDIDFGTYPYVTSSNPSTGGVLTGTGISPNALSSITGVTKSYTTRVGTGPFPTRMKKNLNSKIQKKGQEFGATTGRPRRCGWLDLVALKYAIKITGTTDIALTKIDVLDGLETVKVATGYRIHEDITDEFPPEYWNLEQATPVYKEFEGWNSTKNIKSYKKLPDQLKDYINFIQEYSGIKVSLISNGKNRGDIINV